MKVIIKPIGLFCILAAFVALVIAAVWRYRAATGTESAVVNATPRDAATAPPAAGPSATPASLPPGVLLEPDIASKDWKTLLGNGQVSSSIVSATVPGHPNALHIVVQQLGAHPWDIQIAHPLNVALRGGKRIQLSFWARSKDSCPITAVVEQNDDPYTKVLSKPETLTPDWKQYSETWQQASDSPDNWAKMDFQIGQKVGTLEITGVTIRQVGDGG